MLPARIPAMLCHSLWRSYQRRLLRSWTMRGWEEQLLHRQCWITLMRCRQCCHNGCIGLSDECCGFGNYCPAGCHCHLIDYVFPACCSDSLRTEYLDGDRTVTVSATQAITTRNSRQATAAKTNLETEVMTIQTQIPTTFRATNTAAVVYSTYTTTLYW